MKRTKLSLGVGINDSDSPVSKKVDGKTVWCPYYLVWHNMIKRCYSDKFQKSCPTYKGCSVSNEWLKFTVFKEWMINQDWKGLCLDKDIITPNNKVYSSDNCCFVSQSVNKLLADRGADRGIYPLGVHFDKNRKKFQAHITKNGKITGLGRFVNLIDAVNAYKKAKYDHILSVAKVQVDERVKSGLILHAQIIKSGC